MACGHRNWGPGALAHRQAHPLPAQEAILAGLVMRPLGERILRRTCDKAWVCAASSSWNGPHLSSCSNVSRLLIEKSFIEGHYV